MNLNILMQSMLQIILESLPISSSGHLILIQKIIHAPVLPDTFEYLLHGPTIFILIIYFRATWVRLLMHCWRYRALIAKMVSMALVAEVATVPLYCMLRHYAHAFPLWLGFLMTGIMLLSTQSRKRSSTTFGYTHAVLIGCVQGVAALPGISRLASTYAAGIWCGLSARKAFTISCMIQFPLICAGFMLGIYQQAYAPYLTLCTVSGTSMLVVATIISYAVLSQVEQSMVAHTIYKFGYYMLIPLSLALFL